MIMTGLKLLLIPVYLFVFFILAMLGTITYTCMFFYLGPFAPFAGIAYGTSWAIGCFSGKGSKIPMRRRR
jgi:hypothetical protein